MKNKIDKLEKLAELINSEYHNQKHADDIIKWNLHHYNAFYNNFTQQAELSSEWQEMVHEVQKPELFSAKDLENYADYEKPYLYAKWEQNISHIPNLFLPYINYNFIIRRSGEPKKEMNLIGGIKTVWFEGRDRSLLDAEDRWDYMHSAIYISSSGLPADPNLYITNEDETVVWEARFLAYLQSPLDIQ